MTDLQIKTDNRPRPLVSFHDLPPKVMLDFDYIENEDDMHNERFVHYKGAWYDTQDVQRIEVLRDGEATKQPMGWAMTVSEHHPFAQWDSIVSETFFSGVLFRMWDYDHVVCGSYYS